MIKSRKIANIIDKWLNEKEIIILTGVRQVGKTSLLKIIEKKLVDQNISEKNIFRLDLEDFNILTTLNQNPENIFQYVTDRSKRNYFLIDEIQYLDNPSNFLKLLYDKYAPDIKLIVTGSSALELKANFQDSLVGRKTTFEVLPLDFEEFLQFKGFDKIDYLFQENLPIDIKREFDNQLEEYLLYGGMPAVVLQSDYQKKEKLLSEYVGTYINKDVRMIGKIDNVSKFNNTIKVIASQIGNLLNINELTNTVGVDRRHLENFLNILEHTFVLYRVAPYLLNIRSQITKMHKIYFFDTGIRNAILNNFSDLDSRADCGALFENFVYLELRKKGGDSIYFYRTTAGQEVDFVVEGQGRVNLIEVKFQDLKKNIDERVISSLLGKVNKGTGQVINRSLNSKGDLIRYRDYRFAGRLSKEF